MATEPKAATEEAKIDLFEDDDEFEEFEINQGLNGNVPHGSGALQGPIPNGLGMEMNWDKTENGAGIGKAPPTGIPDTSSASLPKGRDGDGKIPAPDQPRPTSSSLSLSHALFTTMTEWEDKEEGKEVTQQWEDDWDDDDVNDDFSLQLRKELENNQDKK
ncbi:hypothetical protein TIFTF001_028756 [Ficus carica]|uniref:26S proteasome complex subunit SEM1 n=1 Tax=Ficus carica TaxID=3494 RepID=A0AA88IX06_FICCA|nr:hypothetical protein TIFTF001_028756 [Ficus carica]